MSAANNMVKTEFTNVRKREMANGDVGYYIRQGSSYKLVGMESQGVTALEAHKKLADVVGLNKPIRYVNEFTLDDVFNRFKPTVENNPHAKKNHKDYITRYERHIQHRFGKMPLAAIVASDIGIFYHKTKSEYSEAQAYHVCNVIRYLYSRAREWRMYNGPTPMGKGTAFILPSSQRRRESTYKTDDIQGILSALEKRSLNLRDMVKLAYLTGLRLGEIFNLQVCHIDIMSGEAKIVDPKGKRDTYIVLPPSAIEIVAKRMEGRAPTSWLFPTKYGTKTRYLSKTFTRVLESLGINEGVLDSRFKKNFHTIRHTFATEVLASGEVSIGDLQHMLGHKSIQTTQRYIHPAKKAMRAAANYMENMLK